MSTHSVPTPHDHCPHEVQCYSYVQGAERKKCVSSRCCHCGELTTKRYVTVPDPAHGPWGPKILKEDGLIEVAPGEKIVFTEEAKP